MSDTTEKILIVDDEPALVKVLTAYLKRLGFSVEASDNPDTAWRMVEAEPGKFAVAVLDGSMPGMSVHELAARVLNSNPKACVLAASGYPVDMSALEDDAPGRVGFLQKPFTPEMLAAAVRRLIAPQEEGL